MRRITSTDLANWAPTRDCQGHLPLLVRRLIRASHITIIKILIPAGDNVILPGYDGMVEVVDGTEYVPSGKSRWEMGSGRDFKDKAEREFNKRSKQIDPSQAASITFVFVTPYVWTDVDSWVNEKEEKKIWKNLKVIDGQVLEEWIEQFPNVGSWLAKFLSTPFANIQPLDQFWEEWSKNLKYSISSTLVVSGREKEVKELTDFLFDTYSLLSIKASTIEEVIAFIAATIERMSEDLKEELYSKAIIVEGDKDFRLLSSCKNPMVLIVRFQAGSLVDHAVRNGHHVILPIGYDITAAKADIELSRIRRHGFEKGLEEMGFTREEAEHLTRDSGQSLSVLRRLLKFEKNQQPAWAKDGHHLDIIPALLGGMWDEKKEEDTSLISLLAGEPYEKYIAKLTRWKIEKDPPIFQVKSIWRLTSALDAWSILAPFLTRSELDYFKTAFLSVLPETNPALELDPDKRYLASLYGKTPKFSYSLSEGLCQSLILIAVFGEQFRLDALNSSQGFANELVYDLLFDANGDKWCTLHGFLPLLAEASPKSFLQAVEDSLSKPDPPIMKMFGDLDNLFSSTTYYTGLLWALENLLISPDYVLKSTLILAHLARLDPGGKLINRPINTLRAVYIPWYSQTRAEFSIKKYVLEKLVEAEPEISWKVLLSVSPQNHSVVSPIHQCKWRFDTQYLKRTVTYEQIWDFNSFVFAQLINLAKGNEQKCSELVCFFPNLNFKEREKLLQFLKASKEAFEQKENLVWNELRELLSRHREHAEQEWALPSEELDKIEEVFTSYTPKDIKEKYKYLFENGRALFPEGIKRKEMSHGERDEFVNEKRKIAFYEIYTSEGLQGIVELVKALSNAYQISRTAAKSNLSKEEEIHFFALLSSDQTNKQTLFTQQYIFIKAIDAGWEWVVWAYNSIKGMHAEHEILAYFFLSLPQNREVWNLLESADKDTFNIYWHKVSAYFYHEKVDDKLYIINKLQEVNRCCSIIDNISDAAEDISSKLLGSILLKAATITSEENSKLDTYHVSRLFELLYKRNDLDKESLTQLEWIYLPFLADRYANQKPKNLLQRLTRDPEFFVEVVTYVYMPDQGHEEEKYSEEELTRRYRQADSARSLLDSWRDLPGVKEDNTIVKDELREWIAKARLKAKEVNRVYGVDSQIGYLLACFPRNNTYWPPEEICETIDTLNNDVVLSHFQSEIFNSRGMSVRSPFDGGDQERSHAAYFEKMGKLILSKWPLTASALLDLAEGYKRDAKDEDDSARLDELR